MSNATFCYFGRALDNQSHGGLTPELKTFFDFVKCIQHLSTALRTGICCFVAGLFGVVCNAAMLVILRRQCFGQLPILALFLKTLSSTHLLYCVLEVIVVLDVHFTNDRYPSWPAIIAHLTAYSGQKWLLHFGNVLIVAFTAQRYVAVSRPFYWKAKSERFKRKLFFWLCVACAIAASLQTSFFVLQLQVTPVHVDRNRSLVRYIQRTVHGTRLSHAKFVAVVSTSTVFFSVMLYLTVHSVIIVRRQQRTTLVQPPVTVSHVMSVFHKQGQQSWLPAGGGTPRRSQKALRRHSANSLLWITAVNCWLLNLLMVVAAVIENQEKSCPFCGQVELITSCVTGAAIYNLIITVVDFFACIQNVQDFCLYVLLNSIVKEEVRAILSELMAKFKNRLMSKTFSRFKSVIRIRPA